jgi:hypothetical protein
MLETAIDRQPLADPTPPPKQSPTAVFDNNLQRYVERKAGQDPLTLPTKLTVSVENCCWDLEKASVTAQVNVRHGSPAIVNERRKRESERESQDARPTPRKLGIESNLAARRVSFNQRNSAVGGHAAGGAGLRWRQTLTNLFDPDQISLLRDEN